jgi:iron complex outermembrane receptor protein
MPQFHQNLTQSKQKKVVCLEKLLLPPIKRKPVSALRSGLKPMDTPQSVQVIGAEIITQQQAIRLSEVIKTSMVFM